jgi:AAA domain
MNIKEATELELAKIKNQPTSIEDKFNVVKIADVRSTEVAWLWFPYIAMGKLTILEGEEGIGKSWLCCAIAAGVSTGKLFNDIDFDPYNVLMLSSEDGLSDTIKPRLENLDADTNRIFAIEETFGFNDKAFLMLQAKIYETNAKLVIIDPLFAYVSANIDINQANKARSVTSRLASIAEKTNCAIVVVRHIGKARGKGDARAAGLGSIDFRAAARSVLLVGKDPDNDSKRALFQTKNNYAKPGKPIGYEIREDKFWWTGETDLTPERVLSLPSSESNHAEQSEVVEFLRDTLKNGEKTAKEIKQEAAEFGFTEQNLKTARRRLGIKPRKRGGNFSQDGKQEWVWALPGNDIINKG